MALGDKAMKRLARLGYTTDADLRGWQWLWSQGRSFWVILRGEELAAGKYRRWFPRLEAFAAECRQTAPAVAALSAVEREQQRILLAKMREFAGSEDCRRILHRRPYKAAILSTTRAGLAAAEEVFGASGAVILEESEQARWFSEVYRVRHEAFWWYALAWWTLREGLAPEDEAGIRQVYPIPVGCSYWMVASGVLWGGLAGGDSHELWRWDGERAVFIGLYGIGTS